MGILSRTSNTNNKYGLPVSDYNGSSSSSSAIPKRKWSNWMPFFVAIVVILEIAFLGRLDMAKNAAMLDSLVDIFQKPHHSSAVDSFAASDDLGVNARVSVAETCEDWLERNDAVNYSRSFDKDPVVVSGDEQVFFDYAYVGLFNFDAFVQIFCFCIEGDCV